MLASRKHKNFVGAASMVAINGTKRFLYRTESKSSQRSYSRRSSMYACVRVCVSGYEACVRMFVINSAHALWDRDVNSRVTNYRDLGVSAANQETLRCVSQSYIDMSVIEEEPLTGKSGTPL